jgi:cytochrome c oxidase assembly protein subunit 15
VLNFVENPATVQWTHRVLGTLLLLSVIGLFTQAVALRGDRGSFQFAAALLFIVGAQYLLGIATLLLAVPVALGVLHQATAMLLFGAWILWLHHTRQLEPV